DPQLVRSLDVEVALHEVRCERMLLGALGRRQPLRRVHRDEPRLAHQPRDALLADLETTAELQLLEHPRRAVALLAFVEDPTDLLRQQPVRQRAVGERLALPVVVARTRHAERPAQAGDGLALTLL